MSGKLFSLGCEKQTHLPESADLATQSAFRSPWSAAGRWGSGAEDSLGNPGFTFIVCVALSEVLDHGFVHCNLR